MKPRRLVATVRLCATALAAAFLACGCGGSDEPGAGTGGMGAAGAGASGMGAPTSCTITDMLEMSSVIGTVGIVTFTTDFMGIESASIEFGLDTNYGMTAPVDLSEPSYRTLLLGMKTAREYHYRIVVNGGGQTCTGPDKTLMTGPAPNEPRLINITIDTPQPDKVDHGFTVSGHYPSGPAFIIDGDGDYVWWYDSGDATRVRMSYDGKYMWIGDANVMGGDPHVLRVSMDGMEVEEFGIDSEFGDYTHDLAPLADGSVIFAAHDPAGCDAVMERSPTGQVHKIIDASVVTGGTMCAINAVRYFAQDDAITFSDRIATSIAKVTRTGDVLWILGGAMGMFTGDGSMWEGTEHGHQLIDANHLLVFSNGATGSNSIAFEAQLDFDANTATRIWEYDGGNSTPVLGDVQRLPNGNTLVVYTSRGTLDEVDPDGNLVRRMVWDLGGATTYLERRASLYGPTPLK